MINIHDIPNSFQIAYDIDIVKIDRIMNIIFPGLLLPITGRGLVDLCGWTLS